MMPNRLLREGICTSDAVNSLTLEEEVLFYRLLVACDDFGLADGRQAIIKAQCFPLRESASTEAIERWLCGLAQKGLIQRYEKGGRQYVAVNQWEQRVRSARPRFPSPLEDGCKPLVGRGTDRLTTNVRHMSDNEQSDVPLGKGKGKGKGAAQFVPDDWEPRLATVEKLSREFGLVPEDVQRYVAAFIDICKAKGYQYKDFDAALSNCVRQDWPKLRGTLGRVVALGRKRLPI